MHSNVHWDVCIARGTFKVYNVYSAWHVHRYVTTGEAQANTSAHWQRIAIWCVNTSLHHSRKATSQAADNDRRQRHGRARGRLSWLARHRAWTGRKYCLANAPNDEERVGLERFLQRLSWRVDRTWLSLTRRTTGVSRPSLTCWTWHRRDATREMSDLMIKNMLLIPVCNVCKCLWYNCCYLATLALFDSLLCHYQF